MSPSSLIFVAVIATWIAYLVLYVARRREQLATARNVDRFSSQMRVLQRRAEANASIEPSARITSTSLGIGRPLSAGALERAHAPAIAAHTVVASRAIQEGDCPADAEETGSGARHPDGRTRVTPLFSVFSSMSWTSWHQVRAGVLATALVVALVSALLAVFSLVTWMLPVTALVVAGADAALMRAATLARRSARSRAAAARRRAAERDERLRREAGSGSRSQVTAVLPAPEPVPSPAARDYLPSWQRGSHAEQFGTGDGDAAMAVSGGVRAATGTGSRPAPEVFDLAAYEDDPVPAPAPAEPVAAGDGWAPTPVPPPTYALKARAYRPLPPPMPVSEVPVPIDLDADDLDWDEQLHQPRIVGA